jgi:hypothetical protein
LSEVECPRRLRQRADGPDQRRQLRGPDRGEHGCDPRRACGGQVAQARAAGRPPDELSRRRPDLRSRKWPSAITTIGRNGRRRRGQWERGAQ